MSKAFTSEETPDTTVMGRAVQSAARGAERPITPEGYRALVDESCAALGLDGYALRSLDTQLRAELSTVAQSFSDRPRRRAAAP